MKNSLTTILLFLLTASFAFSQTRKIPVPMEDGKMHYSQTVSIDSSRKEVLYSNAKLWFASAFKSSSDLLQLDDKENGMLIGKGIIVKQNISGLLMATKTLKFTVKIQVEDGKYKAEVYDIHSSVESLTERVAINTSTAEIDAYLNDPSYYKNNGMPKANMLKFAGELNEDFNGLLASIKKNMTQQAKSDF